MKPIARVCAAATLTVAAIPLSPTAHAADALTDAMIELTSEIKQLRESLNAVRQATADPWGLALPLTTAHGTLTFADGTSRKFIALAGVTEDKPRRRVPGYFVFGDIGDAKPLHFIPIDTVKALRFASEEKDGIIPVTFWFVDGTSKTYPSDSFEFYMDVKWADDHAVQRYTLYRGALLGAELAIRRSN